MFYISLAFLALLFPDTDTTEIRKHVSEQVIYYTSQINEERNTALNIWAISEIATSNCEALNMVKTHTQSLQGYADLYKSISCKNDIDPAAADSVFRQFWSEPDLRLYNKIIGSKQAITKDILGFSQSLHIHLELLMRRDFSTYYTTEYLNKALAHWIEQVEKYERPKELKYSLLVSNVIWAAFILDDYATIHKYSTEFLQSNFIPVSKRKLRLYSAIDFSFYALGRYDKSLELQREYSLPLAVFIGNKNDIEKIKLRQGAYLYAIGKYEESKNIYEELYNSSKTPSQQYSLFNNLSINYYKLGYSNKYISFQLSALEHKIDNHQSLLTIYRNLFLYYTSSKDLNTALGYIEKAKEVALANSDTTELALIDSYLGTFYWSSYKNHEKALQHFNQAHKILSPEKDYTKYVDLLIEKGGMLTDINILESAKAIFLEMKELALSKSNTPDYLEALINLTVIDLKQKNPGQALKNLNEIKLYSLDDLDFNVLTKYYTVKAEYLYHSGNKRAAIVELRPVIEQITDRANNNTDSQAGFWSVEDEYLDAFALIVQFLIETNNSGEALLVLDQLKTINDASLYNNPLVKAAKLSEQDLAEEKKLNQKLQTLRKKYLNANQQDRFVIKTELERTSAEREQILAKVNLSKEKPLPPVWVIQRTIQPDEMLLHFAEIGTQMYVTHLTTDRIQTYKYEFSPQTQQRFNDIADELASGRTNLHHLHELYELLELNKLPKKIKQISVIPDNYLYRIPLEVLPTQKTLSPINYGNARYLIEDYQFRYFTSLKEFHNNRRAFTNSMQYDFSGFAISDFKNFINTNLPSLPYTTIETENINSALTSLDNKQIFTELEATKDTFKRQISSSRVVHVATHSEVSEQDPLFSTIYLKNSNPEDTLESDQALYAYELFDTPFNSEFVMLNSCSSGSGNYIQGSGVMGISRALRYAGARSLALNLWSVNDKVASEFATDFYSFLNEGATKSDAIRKAKLNQLQKANANPHFWGAYMMIGNPSPVTNKTSHYNYFLLFSVLGATVLLTGFITYKRG